jgi:hypothetical protein
MMVDDTPTFRQLIGEQEPNTRSLTLSYELIAYGLLALLAIALYLALLEGVPATEPEARSGLAAWRALHAGAPGERLIPPSPILFVAQAMGFATLGASEAAGRVVTALAGVALVLSPALFRRGLGTARALLLSALLLGSPVVMITARTASPALWTALIAALGVWAAWRYWETQQRSHAVAALVLLTALALLTEPGGIVTFLTLALAALVARLSAPPSIDEDDPFETRRLQQVTARLRSAPWALAALTVLVVSTVFMLYPGGLSAVGSVLDSFAYGLVNRPAEQPFAFALLVSLFYEPWFWLLGIAAGVTMTRNWRTAFVDRLAVAWAVFGAAALLLYPGARAEHALWLTLPLTLLISRLAPALFAHYDDDSAPPQARWLIAAAGCGLLAMGSMTFMTVARSLARGATSPLQISQIDAFNLILFLIVLAFMLVGYFLARVFWESDGPPLRGTGLALIAFACVVGIGSGWRTAVTQFGNPVDLWQRRAASPDALLLRATLFELAAHTTKGFNEMPLTIISDGDPLLEWAARDFVNAEFVGDTAEAQGDPIILMRVPADGSHTPNLGGPYVGQAFTLVRTWSLSNLQLIEIPAWWSQRLSAFPDSQRAEAVLWVRQDVYDGTSAAP